MPINSLTPEFSAFIQQHLSQHPKIDCPNHFEHSPLSGDAGFRQYFRIHSSPSVLAVMAPLDSGISESASHFAQLAAQLREQGIPTPLILAVDPERNFLLLEDFGDDLLLHELSEDSADLLYGEALMLLTRLQQIPTQALGLADYDEPLLRQEMSLFDQWFIPKLLGYTLTEMENQKLNQCYDFLIQQALEQPQVLVHRDYHSRNLIYREGEAPGVIDFQDAVLGPVTYDLVSLLRDCYIRWPDNKVEQWLNGYGNMLIELGVIPSVSAEQWRKWFDTMGLQRHLKILGIFARLFIRDNKPGYLQDLPLTLRYTLDVAQHYPETQVVAELIKEKLLPLAEQQDWYQDIKTVGDFDQ